MNGAPLTQVDREGRAARAPGGGGWWSGGEIGGVWSDEKLQFRRNWILFHLDSLYVDANRRAVAGAAESYTNPPRSISRTLLPSSSPRYLQQKLLYTKQGEVGGVLLGTLETSSDLADVLCALASLIAAPQRGAATETRTSAR